MKKCPYCAEEIQEEAIICRYCQRDFRIPPPIPIIPAMPSIFNSNIQVIAGVSIDLHKIIRSYPNNKSAGISFLSQLLKIHRKEAESFLLPIYDQFKNELPKISFSDRLKAQTGIMNDKNFQLQQRLTQYDRDGIAYCPKCHSTSLTAHKKGFGIGKAIIGASSLGIYGLVAGNIGSKKVRVTCLKCGHQFWAGKK